MFDKNDIRIDYRQSMNAKFLKKIIQIVHDNLNDEKYKVSEMALACNYSQRQLSRILLKITGMSPVKFKLEIRLLKAYELIVNKTYPNIGDIRFIVGITSNSYFNKKFYERFGVKAGELFKK